MSDTLSPIADLPLRHQRFIVEYLQDANATQAAIRSGYQPHAAQEQGCRLLSKLKPYIEPIGRAHIQKRLMKATDVVESLVRIATTDIRDFMTWHGNETTIKSSDELTPEQAQCIESVTQHETQHVKYLKLKLHPKVKALDALAKHHNLFKQVMATKGLMVVYQRPKTQAVPKDARVVDGEVIEGKWKASPAKIEFKRPGPNGSSTGANGHATGVPPRGAVGNGRQPVVETLQKNGLQNGAITDDRGTA